MAKRKIRISEAEATSDFGALLARVRAGAEVVIERDAEPVAVVHPAQPVRRTISECIALLPEDSTAMLVAAERQGLKRYQMRAHSGSAGGPRAQSQDRALRAHHKIKFTFQQPPEVRSYSSNWGTACEAGG